MKRRIKKYLDSKNKDEYDNVDKIFELYINGRLKEMLSNYSNILFFPSLKKDDRTIQVNYSYHNIYVIIDFFEDKYDVIIYHEGLKEKDFEKVIASYNYPHDFKIEEVIREIDKKIMSHPKLQYFFYDKDKMRKRYSIISNLALGFMMVFWLIVMICGLLHVEVNGNSSWILFFVIVPLTIWFIFDVKGKKI